MPCRAAWPTLQARGRTLQQAQLGSLAADGGCAAIPVQQRRGRRGILAAHQPLLVPLQCTIRRYYLHGHRLYLGHRKERMTNKGPCSHTVRHCRSRDKDICVRKEMPPMEPTRQFV